MTGGCRTRGERRTGGGVPAALAGTVTGAVFVTAPVRVTGPVGATGRDR